MKKYALYALKAFSFARSSTGKRDIALAFSTIVALYEAAHKAGVV